MLSRVLLYSGGLDSLCAWWLLGKPPTLYGCLGHRYQAAELAAVEHLADLGGPRPRLAELPAVGRRERPDAHIPLRNLLLAALAAQGAGTVYLAAVAGESSRDKSGRFFRDASRLASYLEGRPIQIAAPFRDLTKSRLVARYLAADGPPALLLATRSCYAPGDECRACTACFRRWVALRRNGLTSAPPPDLPPLRWPQRPALAEVPGLVRNNADALLALAGRCGSIWR